MLAGSRGDFFPRGITEIWGELASYPNENLAVDEHIALRYPAAYYFFVNKKSIHLKKAVEKGLNIAISDGSFDAIFQKNIGKYIKAAKFNQRKIFSLEHKKCRLKRRTIEMSYGFLLSKQKASNAFMWLLGASHFSCIIITLL